MNLAQLVQSQNFATLLQALDAAGELAAGRTVQARLLSREADGTARIMGLPPGSGQDFGEDYRRIARHARAVVDRVFYGRLED